MSIDLSWMIARPIAHRGLHNAEAGIFENTLSSCKAAIAQGFNIEVDMHLTKDGKPVIFHDATMERMTGDERNVRDLTSTQLRALKIGTSSDHPPTLDELLALTDGKTGLVLEMKGIKDRDDGFVKAVANSLKNYGGPVVIMSFFHWLLRDARKYADELPLGLVTTGSIAQYSSHKMIAKECDIDFVSSNFTDLPCKFTNEIRASGKPVICWTIKSEEQFIQFGHLSDQVTFEGFDPRNVLQSEVRSA